MGFLGCRTAGIHLFPGTFCFLSNQQYMLRTCKGEFQARVQGKVLLYRIMHASICGDVCFPLWAEPVQSGFHDIFVGELNTS